MVPKPLLMWVARHSQRSERQPVVSGASNGRPGHLKEGPPGLRNATPFRHTWVLTIAPVSGHEVRGGRPESLHHGEALQGWVIHPQWSLTESPGTEERGRQPLRPPGDEAHHSGAWPAVRAQGAWAGVRGHAPDTLPRSAFGSGERAANKTERHFGFKTQTQVWKPNRPIQL